MSNILCLVWRNHFGMAFVCFPKEDGSATFIDPENGELKPAIRSWKTLLKEAYSVSYSVGEFSPA